MFDCLCMMNEIRTVGDNTGTVYPKISEDVFMKILYPQEVVAQDAGPDEYMNTFAITGPDKRREVRKQRGYGRKTRKKKSTLTKSIISKPLFSYYYIKPFKQIV